MVNITRFEFSETYNDPMLQILLFKTEVGDYAITAQQVDLRHKYQPITRTLIARKPTKKEIMQEYRDLITKGEINLEVK